MAFTNHFPASALEYINVSIHGEFPPLFIFASLELPALRVFPEGKDLLS